MSVFKLCSERDCGLVAELSCSCDLLCCRHHLGDHFVDHPGHLVTPILLPLSGEETMALQTVTKADFLFLIKQELRNKNAAIERLLREIRQVEEFYSSRMESLLKSQKEVLSVFRELREKSFVPLLSDSNLACLLYTSDAADE